MLREQILRTTRNRSDVRDGKRGWFDFKNLSTDETQIDIYDEISWFGISAQDFVQQLASVRTSSISLHLNSPGGDVFDGIAIYNALRNHEAKVRVTVDGIAASIASVIAMAADPGELVMNKGALMMIHEPFALVIGDARDMRKQAEALDIMGDNIAGIYQSRAGGDVEMWRAAMREETWYGDWQAVDAGLADSVVAIAAAKNSFDLSVFKNFRPASPADSDAEESQPVVPDWRHEARVAVAAAQMEVLSGYGY